MLSFLLLLFSKYMTNIDRFIQNKLGWPWSVEMITSWVLSSLYQHKSSIFFLKSWISPSNKRYIFWRSTVSFISYKLFKWSLQQLMIPSLTQDILFFSLQHQISERKPLQGIYFIREELVHGFTDWILDLERSQKKS